MYNSIIKLFLGTNHVGEKISSNLLETVLKSMLMYLKMYLKSYFV